MTASTWSLGDVADHTERLVAGGGQVLGSGAKGGLLDVGQDDGGAGFSEGLRGGQAHPGAAAGDQGDLTGEVVAWVHGCSSLSSRLGSVEAVDADWKELPASTRTFALTRSAR